MDAFYASVEQRDNPALRGKPVLVGGPSRRGVVAAASYEAREFGVHSAMPMAQALRRCPQAIVVPGGHGRYGEVSSQVFAIFRRFSPLVEGLSLDEAFIDVTGSTSLFGSAQDIAAQIRAAIHDELQLTASAGVARSKFAAKIASDVDKPDGLTVVPDDVAAFLAPLSIERMWGIGPTAAAKLRTIGVGTIGDLAACPEDRLTRVLGSWGKHVGELARGNDDREVVAEHRAKSIGNEQTLERDLHTRAQLEHELLKHSAHVAQRLLHAGRWASVVRMKVKYADFSVRTRQVQLPTPVMDTDSIFDAARRLAGQLPEQSQGIRLVGVTAAELGEGPTQAPLFPDAEVDRRRRIEMLTGAVDDRFGDRTLTRARLLGKAPPPTRKGRR